MKTKRTKQKGITLIALVITIIVLLILAGVSIAMLTGQNGILTQANNAKIETERSDVIEGIRLKVNEYFLEQQNGESREFLDWLNESGYLLENNTINISYLLGKTVSTGNGNPKGKSDVYRLENETTVVGKLASVVKVSEAEETKGTYNVVYYDKNEKRNILDTIYLSNTEESSYPQESPKNIFSYNIENGEVIITKIYRAPGTTVVYDVVNGATEVVIPKNIDGYPVTKIGNGFFYNLNVNKIVIPNSVKEIDERAFALRYSPLKEISFPEGMNETLTIPDDRWGAIGVTITGINGEILAE